MPATSSHRPGAHFLQLPGPTTTPQRVMEAIARPTINHRGPDFRDLTVEVLDGIRGIFKTAGPVIIYPSSGTGAWEAALVNALSPGDAVLMYETGWFATLWCRLARKIGLEPELIPGDWRSPVDAAAIGERLRADKAHRIKAVCVVHNETSTGVTSDIAAVRRAIDEAGHPALLMADLVSSLASVDYQHDAWGVDVAVGGSQKGLMLPPGLSFNALSQKAIAASKSAGMRRSYWDWGEMLEAYARGFFPYTPAINLLQGLCEAIAMMQEEGLDAVFARHQRAAQATRAAVAQWGFETQCRDAAAHSPVLTAVRMPDGLSADAVREAALERCNMSLGNGLGQLDDRVFRIGHLGDFSDALVLGTVAATEAALAFAGVPCRAGGTEAAIAVLTGQAQRGAPGLAA
ncbi:alanine-glyoxylate transaminase/serine-glyoxylate transaminase/serine-pyruvate transaminase [Sphingobium sp. B2D3A]|uniref:pyridoxal-phosphate-dependent aminotransferase family protein n=1 Tax=unclassified Sphingobium TaxID=2611147 RepID=UPI002225B44B|nr:MULTISPECIES: aminotransferase class V-fold PLP-dependent enzyme [unclassified Sphingobium]MCW2337209.1 alanine-glyoxylate transaminase/serine-glyoxylate transaminase/serine-pyruvate transaminase [Sphingobium sp. B2D3A]MCW2383667.1 alanine-glyoxylate transaminase/serine-glyoxylate transaminase/serine-pyruvate transaminase [Sphingobium sp. B2D3D]